MKKVLLLSICLLVLAISINPTQIPTAHAATLTVNDNDDTNSDGSCDVGPGDCTLRDAIDDASDGDTIIVPFDTYVLVNGTLFVDDDITIDGQPNGGGDLPTVDGDDTFRVFDIFDSTVEINDLTVTGGSTTNESGAAFINGGDLTLNNVEVVDNQSNNGPGGGIDNFEDATLHINDSLLQDNFASNGSGGGIFNSGELRINNSMIINNEADNSGGGMENSDHGTARLDDTDVDSNAASEGGGGIFNRGVLTINGGLADNNEARGGGGIDNCGDCSQDRDTPGILNIDGTSISGNSAGDWGGGGIRNNGTADIRNVTIDDNDADSSGGGISNFNRRDESSNFLGAGAINISNSEITNNDALGGIGGGIDNEGVVDIYHSTLSGNTSTQPGGGIHNDGSIQNRFNGDADARDSVVVDQTQLTISYTTIDDNEAFDGPGGGIQNFAGSVRVADSYVINNLAPLNAGLSNDSEDNQGDATMAVRFSIVDGNESSGDGGFSGAGGIGTFTNADTAVSNTLISNNIIPTGAATFGRGGIGLFGPPNSTDGVVTVTDSCIVDNTDDTANGIFSVGVGTGNAIQPVIDAVGNWWGTNDGPDGFGPGTGDSVDENVDFDPFKSQEQTCGPRAKDDGDDDDGDGGGAAVAAAPGAAAPVGATQGFCNIIGSPARGFIGQDSGGDAFCRVINENATFVTNASEIGNLDVLNRGVLQAVDVFSFDDGGNPKIPFAGTVRMCLRGSGQMLFLNAATFDRALQGLEAVSDGGYTCAFLPNAGTIVLVPGAAAPSAAAPADDGAADAGGGETTTAGSVPLNDCRATTTFAVRGRSTPEMSEGNIVTTLPFDLTLEATERIPGWLRLIYIDGQVWVAEEYLSTSGNCGG